MTSRRALAGLVSIAGAHAAVACGGEDSTRTGSGGSMTTAGSGGYMATGGDVATGGNVATGGDVATGGTGGAPLICAPGATQPCIGPGACQGAQVCNDQGTGYGSCDCGAGGTGGGLVSDCRPGGEPCETYDQCCSSVCDSQVCTECSSEGEGCIPDCCIGLVCYLDQCTGGCLDDGQSCTLAAECCSNVCDHGSCASGSCLDEGQPCTSAAQCCSNICEQGHCASHLNPRGPCADDALIDDMEGEGYICPNRGKTGYWYVANDGTSGGAQGPAPFAMEELGTGEHVARTWGSGFEEWALLGVIINGDTYGNPYDASAYSGIQFQATGTTGTTSGDPPVHWFRVSIWTLDTVPESEGGTCVPETNLQCYGHYFADVFLESDWLSWVVSWGDLSQPGWAVDAGGFNPARVLRIEFLIDGNGGADFDLVIDNLTFY